MANEQILGRAVATLADVEEQADFEALYLGQGLLTTSAKIAFLSGKLGILASRCEQVETQEEELFGLEQFALLHPWYCKPQD